MVATTTIKVTPAVRDRLNSASVARGITPGALVEELMDSYERATWFEQVRRGYEALSGADADSYTNESQEWESATINDGLADG